MSTPRSEGRRQLLNGRFSPEQHRGLAELCARYRVRYLALFGSAVSEGCDPSRSDLDFTIDFDAPEGMSLAEQFFGLREELAELFGRDVDLLERSAIRNPYFRRAVESEELPLYVA